MSVATDLSDEDEEDEDLDKVEIIPPKIKVDNLQQDH